MIRRFSSANRSLTPRHRLNYSALNALAHHNSFCPMLPHRLDGENRTLTMLQQLFRV